MTDTEKKVIIQNTLFREWEDYLYSWESAEEIFKESERINQLRREKVKQWEDNKLEPKDIVDMSILECLQHMHKENLWVESDRLFSEAQALFTKGFALRFNAKLDFMNAIKDKLGNVKISRVKDGFLLENGEKYFDK